MYKPDSALNNQQCLMRLKLNQTKPNRESFFCGGFKLFSESYNRLGIVMIY